jgi:hypothetical protein
MLESEGILIDFETKDNGYSPICAAFMAGHLEAVDILAEHGANTISKTKWGKHRQCFALAVCRELKIFLKTKLFA